MELRKDAIVSCTSAVMAEVFRGHDSNEVMNMIREASNNSRKELMSNLENIINTINNPN